MKNVSFLALLALLFIGFKLGKVIAWSWLWVLCPIWGAVALYMIVAIIVLIAAIRYSKSQKKTFTEALEAIKKQVG